MEKRCYQLESHSEHVTAKLDVTRTKKWNAGRGGKTPKNGTLVSWPVIVDLEGFVLRIYYPISGGPLYKT